MTSQSRFDRKRERNNANNGSFDPFCIKQLKNSLFRREEKQPKRDKPKLWPT